jgi:DNA-binding HxlR family transcriptional regulator
MNEPFSAFYDNREGGNRKELFMKTKEELPDCPVATTVQLIGSKWKLLILRSLLARPWRFNELRKSLEGISQKVLTDSLRSMEEDGIITRTVYPEVPPRVEYALSELGESMRPIIKSMEEFGLGYKALADK